MALQSVQEIFQGIMQDPEINSGRPVIKNTRVFVDLIIGHLENGMSTKEIREEYGHTEEQVRAVRSLNQGQVQYLTSSPCVNAGASLPRDRAFLLRWRLPPEHRVVRLVLHRLHRHWLSASPAVASQS
jgi:uncharacterized protein (DUF433 family)